MPVYLARAVGTDMVKIGWSEGTGYARVRSIQTAMWFDLEIFRVIQATSPSAEKWLHRHYAANHVKREWFRFCETMLTIEPPATFTMHPHAPVIKALGGATALARAIGISPGRAIPWTLRGIPAKYWIDVADSPVGMEAGITIHELQRLARETDTPSPPTPAECAA
jgi:hypothetical protein